MRNIVIKAKESIKSLIPKESIPSNKKEQSLIPKDNEKEKLNSILNSTLAEEETKSKEMLAKEQVISQKVNSDLIKGKDIFCKSSSDFQRPVSNDME